jgi:hypothetical protein
MSPCKSQHGLLYPLRLGEEVNFRLTYSGPLKAASQSDNRRKEKHAIRCALSRQMSQLLNHRDALIHEFKEERAMESIDAMMRTYNRGPFLCFPIVREELHLVCDLDILFLRRDKPGSLISGGGDLDNRIKVLFDALRVPQDDNEVRGFEIDNTNAVLVCLTADDRLITGFRVTTDMLLEPAPSELEQNNVQLVIEVEIKATKLTERNMKYFSHF